MGLNETDERESNSWLPVVPAGKLLRITEGLVMRLLRRHQSRVIKSSERDSSGFNGETRFLRSVRNEQIRTALSSRIPRSLLDSTRDQSFAEQSRAKMEGPRGGSGTRTFWERLLTWKKE